MELVRLASDDITNRGYRHNIDEYKKEEMLKLIPVSDIICGT